MKSAICGVLISVVIITSFIIISTIQSNTNKTEEIDTSLNNALYATQQEWLHNTVSDNDEYLSMLKTNLKKQLTKGYDVVYAIEVYGLDYKKGLLDVGITCNYLNSQKQNKEVYKRKTIIVDKDVKDAA